MNAKKYAIRGLIALAAIVALCMFFAGTIRTIATAKVRILAPRQGRLTQAVELKAALHFPVKNEVFLEGAADAQVNITAVKVEVGYEVAAEDVIFEAEIADYDKAMAQLRQNYEDADKALQALIDRDVKLRRTEEAWAQAHEVLAAAKDAHLGASLAHKARLAIEGLTLDESGALPEGASEALIELHAQLTAAEAALANAQDAMRQAERYTISEEVRTYITDTIKYRRALDEAEAEMLELTVLRAQLKSVTAAEDGYITALGVKVGESFNPANAAYVICPKDEEIVLRADTTEVELNITKGMDAYLVDRNGYTIETEVVRVGVTLAGGKYADVELTRGAIKDMGGLYALATGDVEVKIEYRAKASTTLLPAAAVRGAGDDRYVYTLRREQSSLGTVKTITVKTPVTVLAESGGTVSVEENLSYEQVAYMEDRSISEGDSVMEYAN
ncbi:MAG: hypothetical protein ACOYI5_04405 [Christensenellales bacterium]|jgi:multidrug resistance efflux pump